MLVRRKELEEEREALVRLRSETLRRAAEWFLGIGVGLEVVVVVVVCKWVVQTHPSTPSGRERQDTYLGAVHQKRAEAAERTWDMVQLVH